MRRQRAAELEAKADKQLEEVFTIDFEQMDIDITDDEDEDDDKGIDSSDHEKPGVTGAKDIAKQVDNSADNDCGGYRTPSNNNTRSPVEISNNEKSLLPAAKIKKESDNEDKEGANGIKGKNRKSFGGDLSDNSYQSDDQNSTPRYSMRSCGKPKMTITPQDQRQLSTTDVQMLSNPGLLKMLESFQSGEETDIEMLKNPKLLKVLRNLHVPDLESAQVEIQDTEIPSLSTPGLIPVDQIK